MVVQQYHNNVASIGCFFIITVGFELLQSYFKKKLVKDAVDNNDLKNLQVSVRDLNDDIFSDKIITEKIDYLYSHTGDIIVIGIAGNF
jgi:hypothetical protein